MGGALRAAAVDFYGNSWRLALLNALLALAVAPLLVLALWVPLLLAVAALIAGPLALALMHCAVVLAETDDLRLDTAVAGLRLHWRRGLALGATVGVVFAAGLTAVSAYGRAGAWPLAAVALYALFAFGLLQLCLWPLAAREPGSPLRSVYRAALQVALRRPLETSALGLALLAVNAAGAAAALMPLLTLTIAYSFLAAAHYVLPHNPLREAREWLGVIFDHVTKSFDGTVAVDGLELEIEDGEFLVLVGPSGCGKTTALRMLAGLEEITAGRIIIGDRVVNNLAPGDRDVAMVFQSYALYPHMTVYDNLAFGLRNHKVPKQEIDKRVNRAAEILDMKELIRRRPKQLSGGQRQRVALGRAIVREPKAFLMDEPLSNLDAALRVQTRSEILKLQQDLGTTTIYVTHDQVEAMTMGDRIAVMRLGVLQQAGSPEELYTRPANVFVAGFVGSPAMNLVPVEVADGALRGNGLELAVPSGVAEALQPLGRVIVGLRPEDLELAAGEPGEREVRLRGVVAVVEYLGDEQLLHVDGGGVRLIAKLPSEPRARPRDELELAAPLEKLHLFDAGTEQALELDGAAPT